MCKISRGLQNEGRCTGGYVQVCLAGYEIDTACNDLNGQAKWDDNL